MLLNVVPQATESCGGLLNVDLKCVHAPTVVSVSCPAHVCMVFWHNWKMCTDPAQLFHNHLQPFLSAFLLLLPHHKNKTVFPQVEKTQITKYSLLLLNVNYANDCGKLWVNLNEEEHWETNTKANTNYYQYLSFLLHFSWLGFPSAKQISSLIMHLTDVQIKLGFFTKTLMFLWSRIAPFPLLFFQPI